MRKVDTLGPHGYPRPTGNEFKDAVKALGYRARWDDGGTPLPEAMTTDEIFSGHKTVEELGEAYKGASSKTYTDFMSEENRKDPAVTKYKTIDDFVTGYKSSVALVGKKGIIPPDENSTETEIKAYHTALGVPETDKDYKLKALEGLHGDIKITPEVEASFKTIAHKHNMTGKQAEGLFGEYYGMLSDALIKADKEREVVTQETTAKLRNEWGKDFEVNSTIAKRLVAKFGGEEGTLAFGDLGNNPAVLKFLANLGKAISEDSFEGLGPVELSTDAVGAKARLKQIEADPDLMDKSSPRQKGLVEERTKLYAIAYGS